MQNAYVYAYLGQVTEDHDLYLTSYLQGQGSLCASIVVNATYVMGIAPRICS